jgi:1-acyl-sn-glycerol-3-phosphate acyltransferase
MRNFVRFLIHAVLGLITEIEVYNKEYVPTTGSFVLATNHLGVLDIVMPFYVFHRWDMFIMVADKWQKQAWVRWLGANLNFLYIDRFNPDLPALRDVIGRMKSGQVLVIAPEGTRSRTGGLVEAKPGVSYLAAKLGYPIVPAALAGTADKTLFHNLRHLRKTHVVLKAGKPFTLPALPVKEREEALQRYTDEIMCQIAVLLPEEYCGVYGEHPRLKELLELQAG